MASKSFPYYPTLTSAPAIDITSNFPNVIRVSESVPLSGVTASQSLNVWHAAPNMLTARAGGGGAGTAAAGLAFSGFTGSFTFTNTSEKFNLSAWVATANTLTDRAANGCGTQSAALTVGGTIYWATYYAQLGGYKFNGLAWSAIEDPWGVPVGGAALTGTQSAALIANGYSDDDDGNFGFIGTVHKYNGTVWSAAAQTLVFESANQTMSGTQNSAVLIGQGRDNPSNGTTYFNGTTWAGMANRNTATSDAGSSGVRNALLVFGGYLFGGIFSAVAEKFNGTTWSVTSSMLQTRSYITHQSSGTQNTAHVFGGWINAILINSETYTGTASVETGVTQQLVLSSTGTLATTLQARNFFPSGSALSLDSGYAKGTASSSAVTSGSEYTDIVTLGLLETVPAKGVGSVWQVGQNMTVSRFEMQGTGTFSAPLICNGSTTTTAAGATSTADRYSASAWSQISVSSVSRYFNGAFGTQNSTVVFAGRNTSGSGISSADYFNGQNVQSLQNFPVISDAKGTGTYNAGLAYNYAGVGTSTTYKFSLGIWSAAVAAPFSIYSAVCGNQNSALIGQYNSINFSKYNGTVYSAAEASLYASATYSGTSSYCIAVGGVSAAAVPRGETQIYNGTTWSAAPRALAVSYITGTSCCGTPGGALRAGGYNGSVGLSLTEKFLAPLPSNYVRTILSTAPTTITQG